MSGKVGFGLITAATLLLALLHGGDFFSFLLGFELLLGVALFLDARVLCKKVVARLCLPEAVCRKGAGLLVEVELANRCPLPIAELRVEVSCRDRYSGEVRGLSGTGMLDGNDRAVLRFALDCAYCGVLELCLERVTLWDHLGVFSGRCACSGGVQELWVLPRQEENTESFLSGVPGGIGRGERPADRSGSDSGDTYDIRAFRRGDRLKRVHWNMTAKTDELMVRDFGRQTEHPAVVLLDLGYEDEKPERAQWDRFLETVGRVSAGLLDMGSAHEVVWPDTESSGMCRMYVAGEDQMRWMLCALLCACVYKNGEIRYDKEWLADEMPVEIIRINLQGTVDRERKEGF